MVAVMQVNPYPLGTRNRVWKNSSAESLGGASSGFGGFFLTILGRCTGFEGTEQAIRDAGYFLDGSQKYVFVGLRRFVEAGDFSHELQRSGANLFLGDWRIEVEQGFDIPAHNYDLTD
jgi:hypothetical protein